MPEMITLTTAWGNQDFLGVLVQNELERVFQTKTIVLSHSIAKYNNYAAAWQVKNTCRLLKEHMLHVIDIDSIYSKNQERILIDAGNNQIICKNTGLHEMLDLPIISIKTLPVIDGNLLENLIFQINLALNNPTTLKSTDHLGSATIPFATEENNAITGIILLEDYQGHLHTNITKSEIEKKGWDVHNVHLITQKKGQIPFILKKHKEDLIKNPGITTGYNYLNNLFLHFQEGKTAEILGLNIGDYVKVIPNQIG